MSAHARCRPTAFARGWAQGPLLAAASSRIALLRACWCALVEPSQVTRAPAHRVHCQMPLPAGNYMPGTKVCLSDVGDADAIATHHARGADAFARCDPSRPAASSEPTARQNSHSSARLTAAPPAAIAEHIGGSARGCHGLVSHALRSASGVDAQAHRRHERPRPSAWAPKPGTRTLRSRTSGRCSVVVVPTYLIAA
jgi:hypothetical protein